MSITHTLPLDKAADDSIGPDHGDVKDRLDDVRTTDAPTVILTRHGHSHLGLSMSD
jgi:hypothetical protein